MANKQKPVPAPKVPPSQEVAPAEDELPTNIFLGICKVGKLYSVVAITVQGDKVLDREVLTDPPLVKRPSAETAFRISCVRKGLIS